MIQSPIVQLMKSTEMPTLKYRTFSPSWRRKTLLRAHAMPVIPNIEAKPIFVQRPLSNLLTFVRIFLERQLEISALHAQMNILYVSTASARSADQKENS